MKPGLIFKATRISFLPAGLVPFFAGLALAARKGYDISVVKVILGSAGVASAHLAGNLLNDFYDHKSGVDLIDNRRSPFFGGSKVIKDGLLTSREVLVLGIIFLSAAFISGLYIFAITGDPVFLLIMLIVATLTAGYTAPPLKLSYRRLGEADIFILFGVLLVAASFYLFTGRFSLDPVILSLPISFLVLAVILCNEIPDIDADVRAGKRNLISMVSRESGYKLYLTAILLSFLSVFICVASGIVSPFALMLTVFYFSGIKAALMIKNNPGDFEVSIKASAMTIALHFVIGLGIIIASLLI